ncbi:MAG: hypothetical protein LUH36_02150 [Oscillospiraceae bacterium]|nr:hypothetical protein [Oscillospiraceae bacterium]
MSFINDVKKAVSDYHKSIAAAQAEIDDFTVGEGRIYARDEFTRRVAVMTAKKDDLIRAGAQKIRELTIGFTSTISTIDQLDGSKLTDDAKLLEAGIPLSANDLEGIFDRAAGNRTMQQLALSRAKKDGIVLMRVFYDHKVLGAAAHTVEKSAIAALTDEMYFSYTWGSADGLGKIVPAALKAYEKGLTSDVKKPDEKAG